MVKKDKTIRWICGKGEGKDKWVSVDLNLNVSSVPINVDTSDGAWGRALAVLWQHDALEKVVLLTTDQWLEHEASHHCGISHIDLGLEVLH